MITRDGSVPLSAASGARGLSSRLGVGNQPPVKLAQPRFSFRLGVARGSVTKAQAVSTTTQSRTSWFSWISQWWQKDSLKDTLKVPINDLLIYGEIAQVCQDNYDWVKHLPRWTTEGSADVLKYCLLGKMEETQQKFEGAVLKPIYTLAGRISPDEGDLKTTSWQGYIVICAPGPDNKREIIFVFRGTMRNEEWISNIKFRLLEYDLEAENMGRIHRGFWGLYSDALPDDSNGEGGMSPKELVEKTLSQYKNELGRVSTTGWSLGGACATVCAFHVGDYLRNKLGKKEEDVPITAYPFASPRVGNRRFKAKLEEMGVKVWRVSNKFDVVTMLPPPALFVGHVEDDIVPGKYFATFTDSVFDKMLEATSDLLDQPVKKSQLVANREQILAAGNVGTTANELKDELSMTDLSPDKKDQVAAEYSKALEGGKAAIEDDNSDQTSFDLEDMYVHVGVAVDFDSLLEPKPRHWSPWGGVGDFHDLETYLHMLADFFGDAKHKRDPALLNKTMGAMVNPLQDVIDGKTVKYTIPEVWWNPVNVDGTWKNMSKEASDEANPDKVVPATCNMVLLEDRKVWRPVEKAEQGNGSKTSA